MRVELSAHASPVLAPEKLFGSSWLHSDWLQDRDRRLDLPAGAALHERSRAQESQEKFQESELIGAGSNRVAAPPRYLSTNALSGAFLLSSSCTLPSAKFC